MKSCNFANKKTQQETMHGFLLRGVR